MNKCLITSLIEAIEALLLAHKGPIKEYDLILLLQKPPYQLLNKKALVGELALFRTHFLVFHALYELQAYWRTAELFELQIDPLSIQVMPYRSQANQAGALQKQSSLADYYRNWQNLEKTTETDVEVLLTNFWKAFIQPKELSKPAMQRALKTMELTERPTQVRDLKQQYYRLVHCHHPDKGGDEAVMKTIQAAYQALKNTYK